MLQMWGVGTCAERMSDFGKCGLEGDAKGQPHSRTDSRPRVSLIKSCIKDNSTLLKQSDLYLNPDPLLRLIGQANETQVKIENQNFTALIDSGAQISQLTESLVKALGLEMKQLKELLPLDGAGGIDVPYLGYVEARLAFPEIQNFDEDCLFLVMSDHTYGDRVPVTIGTLHIDMILDKASQEELESLGRAWDRGFVNRRIQAKRLQIDNESQLSNIKGTVKLTRNVKLKPGQTQKVKSRSNHPLNGKRVNVILEPTEEEEGSYTVPSYNFVKGNSRSVHVGLRNLSCRAVTLKKGTVVAQLSPANVIPKMLAPKPESVKSQTRVR